MFVGTVLLDAHLTTVCLRKNSLRGKQTFNYLAHPPKREFTQPQEELAFLYTKLLFCFLVYSSLKNHN